MRKIFALTVVALLGSTAFAAGEVYRWKDPNGIWHYSDQPQPGAELVRGARLGAPSPTSNACDACARTGRGTCQRQQRIPADQQRGRRAGAQGSGRRQDASSARRPRRPTISAVQARRIYKTDDKGNASS